MCHLYADYIEHQFHNLVVQQKILKKNIYFIFCCKKKLLLLHKPPIFIVPCGHFIENADANLSIDGITDKLLFEF